MRRDDVGKDCLTIVCHFYSRASCEARQDNDETDDIETISTHAPRVRRDELRAQMEELQEISTHAPRVRRDSASLSAAAWLSISTHAPRVRRDGNNLAPADGGRNFYSRASCEARPERIPIC